MTPASPCRGFLGRLCVCPHDVSGTVCARLCASDGILRLSSTAKWQDDFVYTKLYLAPPFSMSNLRTDCQQVRAAEVSAGSVQMTVRRSAGGEAVKGSVRSAWYAKTVLSFAFGSVEGPAGDTPCPHASALRLRGTGKAAKSADFRLPGIPKIHCILVPVCYPALAFLTVKNAEKVNPDLLFALPECLPRNTKKGGNCPALVISPQRLSCYRGTFSPPSSSYSTTSPAASACAPFPSCALLRSAASRAV